MKWTSLTEAQQSEIMRLKDARLPLRQISRQIGRAYGTVQQYVKRYGGGVLPVYVPTKFKKIGVEVYSFYQGAAEVDRIGNYEGATSLTIISRLRKRNADYIEAGGNFTIFKTIQSKVNQIIEDENSRQSNVLGIEAPKGGRGGQAIASDTDQCQD